MPVCDGCGIDSTDSPATETSGAGASDDVAASPPQRSAARDGAVPFTWVTSVENGTRKAYCEQCGRDHLRSIEAKLDSAWW